jgi:uncharacterized protein (DUF1810 family)
MDDLDRFKHAQDQAFDGFEVALSELLAGRKRSHWIWYVFPQLAGMGRSSMAVRYGLRDAAEATAYLRDPVLRARLLAVVRAVAAHLERRPAPSIETLMGSTIDALKLVSSMTLFREVARRLNRLEPHADYAEVAAKSGAILEVASEEGLPACVHTRRRLGG